MNESEWVSLCSDPQLAAAAWEAFDSRAGIPPVTRASGRLFFPQLRVPRAIYHVSTGADADKRISLPEPSPLLEHPPDLESFVAFCSISPRDVVRAEELALEAGARLSEWGVKPPTRVAWWLCSSADTSLASVDAFHARPDDAVRRSITPTEPASDAFAVEVRHRVNEQNAALGGPFGYWQLHVAERVASWLMWDEACARGLRVPALGYFGGDRSWPWSICGRRFSEFAPPGEPLMGICALGLCPVDVRGDVFILAMPTPPLNLLLHTSREQVRTFFGNDFFFPPFDEYRYEAERRWARRVGPVR